jgi:hypothetical protein
MKKLVLSLVILALAVLGWYAISRRGETQSKVKLEQVTSRPSPANATFIFEDGPVTLKGGVSSVYPTPGSAIATETSLSDDIEFGDINNDGKNDAVAILMQNSGGSGLFIFIAAYVSGNVAYKGTNAVFVGDRVSPQSLRINSDGTITLTYLDRKADEPMAAAPTVEKTRRYALRAGELEEI